MAQSGGTPCQSASSMSSAFMSAYPTATIALIPAGAAADCLKSVPVAADDFEMVEEMQMYLNWQSNLAFLNNPPKEYKGARIDIEDATNQIKKDLKDNKYKDEFTVMTDLQQTLAKSGDFHLVFTPDITQIFTFRRGNVGRGLADEFAIASVSSDGKSLPKLYNYFDIFDSEGANGWTPSPITEINNGSAEAYLQKWSESFTYHEDHARYNRLFPNQASGSMGRVINQFGRSTVFDGDYTYIKHENGTQKRYLNHARVPLNYLNNVRDGRALFNKFCNLGPPKSRGKRGEELKDHIKFKRGAETKVFARQSARATPTGYPTPQIFHSEGVIGGYYLSGSGYDDVAVLSVPSFQPETNKGPEEFQDLTGQFLANAKKAGKTKLVIDLRGNGGGRVFLGYDLFKQLFPKEDPYGAWRFRANQAFDQIGKFFNDALDAEGITYDSAIKDLNKNGLEGGLALAYQSFLNYRVPITVEGKNFTSWAQYFGPHEFNGDKFTSVARRDLNNFFSDDLTLDVTGYRTRATKLNQDQPFEAKNIVLLQDGGCGSTCAIFTEFMKTQGKVQQIVVGGKPQTGTMQGVGGSKGSQVISWTEVYRQASVAYDFLSKKQKDINSTDIGKLYDATRPLMRSAYDQQASALSRINLRDNMRMGDTSGVPLEFIYEAADCRFFYTNDMYRDVTNVWKKTVDAHFGDKGKHCVEGSTGDKTSISGGFQVAASGNTKKGAAANVGVSGVMVGAMVAVLGVFALL